MSLVMDARPILCTLARLLHEHGLEAVLIDNAAAFDLDFLFRKTPANLRKLKAIAKELESVLMRPYYPVSGLFRISRDGDLLQVDFMGRIDGVRSMEGVRSRATRLDLDGYPLLVATLADIVRSKRAAGRPQDLAALAILEKALHAEKKAETDEA